MTFFSTFVTQCTGISIIGHSLLTLYYLNNKKIYEAFLRIENKSSNGSWLSEQAIKDAINISDIDKQEGVKYLTLYMFCGFVLIIVSILAYQIRKKSGNWKIDLNLYHLVKISY